MANLGSLFYTLQLRDLTDADLKKVNDKLKNLGFDVTLTPKILKELTQSAVPKGIKIELDPTIKNDALARAVEGKTMKIAVSPLLTGFREAIARATRENPPTAEVGVSEARLRNLVQGVLNKQGFLLNISTVNDNYSKVVQAKLNGTRYTVKIHADAKEITQSVQASLMQVQSRSFGLKVSRDILYKSIDDALMGHKFPIQVYVKTDSVRNAVQDALGRTSGMSSQSVLDYNRLMKADAAAAKAELDRLKAAQHGAADAAKAHATASVNLGSAMGRNITIAGELGSAMASLYSIHAAKEFLSQVIEIGGELEHQKIAMDTIFGDQGKTIELFGQIKGLARNSPFGVMELTKSVKALSAYGTEYNEIYDTAKRLADISAATSVDINRLILAFGKTKSRGFLDGLEAKQFAYANIPIYELVRKKLEELEGQAVTTAEVMARMKKREIGFDIVKEVLWDQTNEGGKFYNMQEALAGSVKTSWKLVRDNIELMFGEIAESGVGDALKSIAEILQGLTRNWRTLGWVIGTAAAGLGVYKVATLATNSAVQKSTLTTYNNIIAQKHKNAEDLKAWGRIMQLTAAEKMQIATANKLTNADLRQAIAKDRLTTKNIAQLYWSKKISAEQVKYLVKAGLIDAAEAKMILKNNRLALSFQFLGQSIAKASKAALAFLMNPWTLGMAAISAIVMLWQRNSEEADKAKELGENVFTKASEGAQNLKKELKDLAPSSEGLSDLQLADGIERMKNMLKDYSVQPFEDISKSLINQQGEIATLAEQYDSLRQSVENAQEAMKLMEQLDLGGKLGDSIDSADSGWFDDSLLTDIEDYAKAQKEAINEIIETYKKDEKTAKKVVDAAMKLDSTFEHTAQGLKNYAARYKELMLNADKYYDTLLKINSNQVEGLDVDLSFVIGKAKNARMSKKELLKEWEQTLEDYKLRLEMDEVDLKNLTPQMKLALRKTFKEAIDKASPGVRLEMQQKANEIFGNLDFSNSDVEEILSNTFSKAMSKVSPQLANEIAYGKPWDKLSDAEKTVVENLVRDAGKDTVRQMGDEWAPTVQGWLDDNTFYGRIMMRFASETQATDLQKRLWEHGDNIMHYDLTRKFNEMSRGARSTKDVQENFVKEGKDIKERLDAEKKNAHATKESIAEIQKEWDDIAETYKRAGFGSLSDAISSGSGRGGNKKDPLLDELKAKFKDLKDAWAMYKEWQKTVGDDAAFDTVANSGLFQYIDIDEIPRSVEAYDKAIQELQAKLESAGIKGNSGRESLLNEMIKTLFDVRKSVIDEQLKLALDKVSKEAEKQLADWNLYDKIQKATGNKNLAFSIAFGMDATAETDYPKMIESQLDKQVKAYEDALSKKTKGTKNEYSAKGYTYSSLKELYDKSQAPDATDADIQAWKAVPEEIRKAWEKANGDIVKYFDQQREAAVNILTEYQDLQDKLDAIEAKRKSALEAINAKREDGSYVLSDEERERKTKLVNTQADYDKFTQSNEYLRFFNDIYGLTLSEANKIGDLIQLNLNQKLQAGLISIYEYEQQMEKVRQQLDALRNVKSDALTFMTGGIKGLSDKKLKKEQGRLANDEGYQKALQKQVAAQNALNKAKEEGNEQEIAAAEEQLNLANQSVKSFTKIRDAIIKDKEKMQKVVDVANIANNIAQGMSDAFNTLRDMADSFGFDTESDAWNTAAAVMDTMTAVTGGISKMASSLMSGDIGGAISGAFQTVLTPFTIWNQLHDKKLQKDIERSQKQQKGYERMINAIERRMTNFLGNPKYSGEFANADPASGGAYGAQRDLMKKQLAEMERQKADMEKMKKKDPEAIADMADQIDEMKVKIKEFAMETAKDLYGIDLKDWASQLGDVLFDAWKKGEDGAEAFKRKAGDIIGSVMNNILKLKILEPMMESVSDYLFGKDGESGAFGKNFELTPDEVDGLAKEIMKGMEGVDAYNSAMERVEKLLNEKYGLSMKGDDSSKSGLSAGIQGVTEDTADLLASYINAIRADVSVSRINWEKLMDDVIPQMNVIAQAQLDAQKQIAANTLRNAVAAEAIQVSASKLVELNSSMEGSWRRIATRTWGSY